MTDKILKNLKDLLEKKDLRSWTIKKTQQVSKQRLYACDDNNALVCHQQRSVEEDSYHLTLHLLHGENKRMGTGQLDIDPLTDLNTQIDLAISLAANVSNEPWQLAEAPEQGFPDVATADMAIVEDAEVVIDDLETRTNKSLQALTEVNVNSAELFVDWQHRTILTASGINHNYYSSDLYIEVAMEKLPLPNQQEVHSFTTAVAGCQFDIEQFIREAAEEVKSLGHTVEPDTQESACILINSKSIANLIDAIRMQLYASLEYHKLQHLLPGDNICAGDRNPEADSITLTLDPFVEHMVESSSIGSDGLLPQKAIVIKDNIVDTQIIGNRFGQYLNKEPNGITGNMILEPGNMNHTDLLSAADEVLEIIDFSSLLVSSQQMTWSSEIKLGKLHKADGSISLIKGGVVAGNISENIADCLFSAQTDVFNYSGSGFSAGMGYCGPKYMLIRRGVSIAGK